MKMMRMERIPELLKLALSGSLWYFASAIANTTSRKILLLENAPSPLFLTTVQLFFAAILTQFVICVSPKLTLIPPSSTQARRSLILLSLAYTIGFLFVNKGYVMVNVSLAETLRSAEPVVSVVFAVFWLKDEPVTMEMVASMIPVVLGGALSSAGDNSFSLIGLGFVSVSNVSFSLRSVMTKKTRKVYTGDAFNVFYQVTAIGTIFLTITAVVLQIAQDSLEDLRLLVTNSREHVEALPWQLLVINAASYTIYNQMSFYVLSKVEMVTHAVANAVRRTVTIVCSVWYFGNEINQVNAMGIASSIVGVILYARAKGVIMQKRSFERLPQQLK